MKNRVTLKLEDTPYKFLRVMAASENISMSTIVEEFIMGERSAVSDEEKIQKIEEEHGVEPDLAKAETYQFNGRKIKKQKKNL